MLIAEFQQYLFGFTIFIVSMFLILLVLVQRGRGGGLTGALGGAGGQSAFGTKAGDLFTKITVGIAALWIFLCAAAVYFLKDRALPSTGVADRNVPAITGSKDPGDVPPAGPAPGTSSGITDAPAGAGLNLPPLDLPAVDVPAAQPGAETAPSTPETSTADLEATTSDTPADPQASQDAQSTEETQP